MTEYQKHAEDLITEFENEGQSESMAIISTVKLLQYALRHMGRNPNQVTQKALNYLTGVGKVVRPYYLKGETTSQNIYKGEKSERQIALDWWANLNDDERHKVESDLGYYGHDIGTTEADVIFFYSETIDKPGIKWWNKLGKEKATEFMAKYNMTMPLNANEIGDVYIKENNAK